MKQPAQKLNEFMAMYLRVSEAEEVDANVLEEVMYTYANQMRYFDAIFDYLDEYDKGDSKLIVELFESLMDDLNCISFTNVREGIRLHWQWIENRNSEYFLHQVMMKSE